MKKVFIVLLIGVILSSGCSTNKADYQSGIHKVLMAKVNEIQHKISDCISRVNSTEDGMYVDKFIIVLGENSPNANNLYNSSEKINDNQADILSRFRESSMSCREISSELPSQAMVETYKNFYLTIDAVYKDLVDKRITIGVANQERAMHIHYARSRWTELLKREKLIE